MPETRPAENEIMESIREISEEVKLIKEKLGVKS
jgi:hypothetical protein